MAVTSRFSRNGAGALTDVRRQARIDLSQEQLKFIETLNFAARILDSEGLDRSSWMLIAGGGVFTYQLDHAARNGISTVDRAPTDVDIVVANLERGGRHILDVLRDRVPDLETSIRTEPVHHFGHILKGPALSIEPNGKPVPALPIDIITELSQRYPADHKFKPSHDYIYPPTDKMLEHSLRISNPLIDGENIQVAHPGFIAFYKLMLARNTEGKQDTDDLVRLKAMGMLEPSKNLGEVLQVMCHSDVKLIMAIWQEINDLQMAKDAVRT